VTEPIQSAFRAKRDAPQIYKSFTGAQSSWEHFVTRSAGEEGARWVAAYVEAGGREVERKVSEALDLLRGRRIEAGHALLAEIADGIGDIPETYPGVRAVASRWYLTASAYSRFLTGDHEGAGSDVDHAGREVEKAIGLAPALLPIAVHAMEFHNLHILIARKRRRWEEMRRRVDLLYRLAEDVQPLCRARDGSPIHFTTIERALRAMPEPTAEEILFIENLCNRTLRLQHLDLHVRKLYAPPGLVIPSP
jgi:hypothetical protein